MGNPHTDNRTFDIPRQGPRTEAEVEADESGESSESGADSVPDASRTPHGTGATGPTGANTAAGAASETASPVTLAVNAPEPSEDAPPSGPPGAAPRSDSASEWRRSYGQVVRVKEFQSLWASHALSMTGNFVLNIAVTSLVFQQTASATAAGLTIALTFLPQIIGGPLLSGLADLFPRRRVIVISDLTRAAFVLSIGIPGLPLWAIWVLVFCSILPVVPFGAARAALLAEIVQGDRYVAGSAILNLTSQAGMLVGLVSGGAIVMAIGPNTAVMFNAATFLFSAAIVGLGVRARPAPHASGGGSPSLWSITRDGTRLVFGDARLRTLGLFAWLAGLYMVPYGLANPMAAELGGGAATAGLIMAGPSMGAVIGGLVLTRLIGPDTRTRLLGPLALVASLPLLAWIFGPPLWLMVLLLAVSGMAASYQFVANAAFVLCAPPEGRGLAFGLVAAGLQASQGIGILVSSLLSDAVGAHLVITVAGAIGVCGAAILAFSWSRLSADVVARTHGAEADGARS